MGWKPEWEEKYRQHRTGMPLDIEEPPCKECQHWRPRVKTDRYGEPDGIVLCTSEDQYHDFSCYRKKGESK